LRKSKQGITAVYTQLLELTHIPQLARRYSTPYQYWPA